MQTTKNIIHQPNIILNQRLILHKKHSTTQHTTNPIPQTLRTRQLRHLIANRPILNLRKKLPLTKLPEQMTMHIEHKIMLTVRIGAKLLSEPVITNRRNIDRVILQPFIKIHSSTYRKVLDN